MTDWISTRRIPLLILAVVLVIAVTLGIPRLNGWLGGAGADLVVTAEFDDTTGLYVGNRVTYLGVPVGEVTDIEPEGTTMRVVMHLDEDLEVPAEAGAEILQGSLVTDRFVELGPAYTGGPTLADGDHIANDHTRAPATVDEIASALDDLVLALDADGRGGKDLGELLATTADGLEGNGRAIREALAHGRTALEILNSKGNDLEAVTAALSDLVSMLAARDQTIRTFTSDSAAAVAVLAEQREEIAATLASFDQLVTLAHRFLNANGDVLADDLAMIDDIVAVVRQHQGSLDEAYDTMPTMAENFHRAYDYETGRLRVQFSFDAGPFSGTFMNHFCSSFLGPDGQDLCQALSSPDGTGLLDPLLNGLISDNLAGVL